MRLRSLALAGAAILAAAPASALAGWSPPTRVSAPDRAVYATPSVALGRAGEALAAWTRTPAGAARRAARAQVVTRAAGARAWSRPRALSGPGVVRPRVAMNARGDAVAAWANGRILVGAVRRGADGPWSAGRIAEAAVPVHEHLVAVGDRGGATVLWSERRGSGYLVRLATRASARAGWSVRAARLGAPGPAPPALALSPGRGALVAWVAGGRVRAARTAGGAFERGVEMSAPDAETPGVALSPSGAGLTSWSVRLPGGTSVLLASTRRATTTRWGAAEDLGIGAAPVAALSDRGDAVVAWDLGAPGAPQGVEAATRRGSGPWRSSTIVARRDCDCALGVGAAVVDGGGTAVVAWRREADAGADEGGVASLAPGASEWQRPAAEPTRSAGAPALGAGLPSGALAAWAGEGAGGGVRVVELRP